MTISVNASASEAKSPVKAKVTSKTMPAKTPAKSVQITTPAAAPKPTAKPSAKPVAKPVVKAVVKAAQKPAAKAPAKSIKRVQPTKPAVVKKPKLIRDSFTMPQADHDLIKICKKTAIVSGRETKKSEVVRAAIQCFAALSAAQQLAAYAKLQAIALGRPKG